MFKLQTSHLVNDRSDAFKDGIHCAKAFHMMVYALFLIPIDERSSLSVINIEAFLDGCFIVVAASAFLSAVDKP